METSNYIRAPRFYGTTEGVVWGGVSALATSVCGQFLRETNMPVVRDVGQFMVAGASIVGVVAGANALINAKENYKEAHVNVDSADTHHHGTVKVQSQQARDV